LVMSLVFIGFPLVQVVPVFRHAHFKIYDFPHYTPPLFAP